MGVGEELFDSYGEKCNSRFFVHYGFTLEENDANQAQLRFGERTFLVGIPLPHAEAR